ncbi:MAG TPA: hypothetical protein VMT34_17460 [Aggregatilineales bacterium]|nr:hypothetical protein [Aggregatilineales bacterium]
MRAHIVVYLPESPVAWEFRDTIAAGYNHSIPGKERKRLAPIEENEDGRLGRHDFITGGSFVPAFYCSAR